MSRTNPFFLPKKEFDLINSMNEELIEVNIEQTDDNIYGESSTKYYDVGFRVNCLIQFNEPEINQDEFGADTTGDIEMYFQRQNLSSGSLNFFPEIGDIVDWNDTYWEVDGVTEPQLVAGHPAYKHQIKATAHYARLSSLQIEERPR